MQQIIKNIFLILTRREKRAFFRLVWLDVFVSVLDICFLVLLLFVINFYSQPDRIIFSSYPLTWLNDYPLLLIVAFFFLFSIKNIFAFFVFRKQFRFVYEVASRISKQKLLNYLEGNFSDYISIDSAVYTRSISQQPIEFSHYLLRGLQQIIGQVILIFLTIIPIIIYNAVLFPLLLIILVPPVVLLAFILKNKLNAIRVSGKTTSERSIQHLKEALAGFVESNVYGKNDFFTNRYHQFQSKLNHYLADQQIIQNLPARLIEVFAVFGLLVLILINAYTNTAAIDIITIGAFIAAAYKIIPGIVKILNSAGQLKTYSFTATGLPDAKSRQTTQPINPISSIQFDKVSFSHEKENILFDFSLLINAGEFVGISGFSGKGKTMIVNLLLGFLTPQKGEIMINGMTTSCSDRQKYWNNISYVKQQSFLMHDTILKNITMEESEPDHAKLATILSVTGVDELVNQNPAGINSVITEEGKNISGGQRQRIILARALYKDFDTLILDEPFNELDKDAENILLKYLQKISIEGKSVILITHNNHGLSFCTKLITMA